MHRNTKRNYTGSLPWAFSFFISLMIITALNSCSKMDATYHDFWKNGEEVYPASADSLVSYSGKDRIELQWLIIGDPSIAKTVIYWNNETDSMVVPVKDRSRTGIDTMRVMLNNLPEGNYAFDIYSYDKEGRRSVVANITGRSYGDEYIGSLLGRLINSAFYIDDTVSIVWGDPADETSIGTELLYKDTTGAEKQLLIPPHADSTFISDFAFTTGSTIRYRTLYVPDSTAIDTFYTPYEKAKVLGPRTVLPKDGWTVTASSYDNRNGRTDRLPEKAIDNNTATAWVNLVGSTAYPHTFTIDMGQVTDEIYGVSLYVTQRAETPKTMNVYISNDGQNWQLMGLFTVAYETGRQYFDFSRPQSFRYLRFKFLNGNGSDNIVIYEAGAFTR